VHQYGASRLELVLVNEGHYPDVVLGPDGRGDDGVALVDDLLERADAHGGASEVVDLGSILLRLVLAGAQALLAGHELLLHEEVVLDALELEQAEAALGERRHGGEARRRLGALLPLLPPADAGWGGGGLVLLLLLSAVAGLAVAREAALLPHPAGSALPHLRRPIRVCPVWLGEMQRGRREGRKTSFLSQFSPKSNNIDRWSCVFLFIFVFSLL
jgi:hypothetical protein